MQHNYWIYLFIMFAVTYLVRVLPLVVFKKKITNRFVRSFLTYIPYAVLAAMTFPAVFFAVDCIPAAAAGVVAGVIAALAGGSCLLLPFLPAQWFMFFCLFFKSYSKTAEFYTFCKIQLFFL